MDERTFQNDLSRNLEDPEFLVYYLSGKAESEEELLKRGIIHSFTRGSMALSKTSRVSWGK